MYYDHVSTVSKDPHEGGQLLAAAVAGYVGAVDPGLYGGGVQGHWEQAHQVPLPPPARISHGVCADMCANVQ